MLIRVLLAAALALVVVLLTAVAGGALVWSRATGRVEAAILQRAADPPTWADAGPGAPADADAPSDARSEARSEARPDARVPAPVRRYLEQAIPDGAAPIRVARLEQSGEFLLTPPDGWVPFTATQLFTTRPPAMLWDASMRMAPLLSVRVRDSYHGGVGSMHGAVLGLFTVLREAGPDRMAGASLLRYLAESPWLPTRLRPTEALQWTAMDDSTALATLTDGDVTVSLEFRFTPGGEIREVYADRRFRGEDEDPRWAPWIGRFDDYEILDGYRIPTRGEVSWVLDGEERPYWRGRIESARYETATDADGGVTTARSP